MASFFLLHLISKPNCQRYWWEGGGGTLGKKMLGSLKVSTPFVVFPIKWIMKTCCQLDMIPNTWEIIVCWENLIFEKKKNLTFEYMYVQCHTVTCWFFASKFRFISTFSQKVENMYSVVISVVLWFLRKVNLLPINTPPPPCWLMIQWHNGFEWQRCVLPECVTLAKWYCVVNA